MAEIKWMIILNPKSQTGTFKNIQLEKSSRRGALSEQKNIFIVILNPKSREYQILSKVDKKSNIPRDIDKKTTRKIPTVTSINQSNQNKDAPNLPLQQNLQFLPPTYSNTNPNRIEQIRPDININKLTTPNTVQSTNQDSQQNFFLRPADRLQYDITRPPTFISNTIQTIHFEINRLIPLINHIQRFRATNEMVIVLQNLKFNISEILKSQNISQIRTIFTRILRELDTIYRSLNRTSNLQDLMIQLRDDRIENIMKPIIDTVLTRFYNTLNVIDTNLSDFTQADLQTLFTTFPLKAYPDIYSFLLNELKHYSGEFQNALITFQNNTPLPDNQQKRNELVVFFILKYGLNFPQVIYLTLFNQIANNIDYFKPHILQYIIEHPEDTHTIDVARNKLNIQVQTQPLRYRYESDILENQQPSTTGNVIRTVQNIAEPIKTAATNLVNMSWRNPINTGLVVSGALAGAKTLYDTLRGDLSFLERVGLYHGQEVLKNLISENQLKLLPNDFKNIYRPVARYISNQAVDAALPLITEGYPQIRDTIFSTYDAAKQGVQTVQNTINTLADTQQQLQNAISNIKLIPQVETEEVFAPPIQPYQEGRATASAIQLPADENQVYNPPLIDPNEEDTYLGGRDMIEFD